MGPVIEVRGLRVGGHARGISFRVAAGETHALLGHAGTGKTAVLEAVAGLRRPGTGTVRIRGVDPYGQRAVRVGGVWREGGLYPGLTVAEIADSRHRWTLGSLPAEEALRLTGLARLAGRPFERLTAGERRLLDLSLVLLDRSDVLLLEDPVAGLDLGTVQRIWTVLRTLADSGVTILFSTRSVDEARRADHTTVLDRGRPVLKAA